LLLLLFFFCAQAEQDKLAAIIDLERLSRDLLQEKKEKRKLEARIREMSSQLLVGGPVRQRHIYEISMTFAISMNTYIFLKFGILYIPWMVYAWQT
jgi:hypothetical protein